MIVYAEGGFDLSMEQVLGVIPLEDELIIQALLSCIFSEIMANKSMRARLTSGCKLPNLD